MIWIKLEDFRKEIVVGYESSNNFFSYLKNIDWNILFI